MKPVAVLGIGNTLLRDEGIGVHAVEALQREILPDWVELIDGGTGGADLMEAMANREKIIVVDAAQMDQPPGTIGRFTDRDLAANKNQAMSLHEVGLAQALEMTRQLGCAPKEVVIFGVAPATVCFGLELTDEVKAALPRIVQAVREELLSNTSVPLVSTAC